MVALDSVRRTLGLDVVAPFPDAAEAADLARRRDAGDRRAREELIVRNLPLALRLAGQESRRGGLGPDDALSAAAEGLVRAADAFDPARGVPFGCFAAGRVRGALANARAGNAGLVRVPRRRRAGATTAAARLRTGGRPDGPAPLDRAGRRDPEPDLDGPPPLREAVAALPDPLDVVVRLRYGLDGPPRRQDEVAARLGRSVTIVRQWERAALGRLRRALWAHAP